MLRILGPIKSYYFISRLRITLQTQNKCLLLNFGSQKFQTVGESMFPSKDFQTRRNFSLFDLESALVCSVLAKLSVLTWF